MTSNGINTKAVHIRHCKSSWQKFPIHPTIMQQFGGEQFTLNNFT